MFLAASFITMESVLLKELDFGLQNPTGPTSGVVVSVHYKKWDVTVHFCHGVLGQLHMVV